MDLEDFSITYIASSTIVHITSVGSAWDFFKECRLRVQILAGTKFRGWLSFRHECFYDWQFKNFVGIYFKGQIFRFYMKMWLNVVLKVSFCHVKGEKET